MNIQEAIRSCDREEVISIYNYKYIYFQEYPQDLTIREIRDRTAKRLNEVMDKLCEMTPVKKSNMIFLAVHCIEENGDDITFNLYDVEDLKEKKEFYTSYGFEFTPFAETLAYEIADTYLTNYYLNDLIANYLFEVTWTGWDQDNLEDDVNRITESAKEAEEHPERLKALDFDKMREELGLEKHDPRQWDAYMKLIKQQGEYCNKCAELEIEKWRESCLETGK